MQEYTLVMLSTYCFYTATLVTRSRLGITSYVHSLFQDIAVDLRRVSGGLLVKNKGRLASPSVNHCQGQLQTPQSVTEFCLSWYILN